jgi:hypothetical protein
MITVAPTARRVRRRAFITTDYEEPATARRKVSEGLPSGDGPVQVAVSTENWGPCGVATASDSVSLAGLPGADEEPRCTVPVPAASDAVHELHATPVTIVVPVPHTTTRVAGS